MGERERRHTFRRFAGGEVSCNLRACQATTDLYLFTTLSPARGSASKAAMWGQPVVSPGSVGSEVARKGIEISKVTSVAGADSSPNKVGWVVSEVVDMTVVVLLRLGLLGTRAGLRQGV